MENVCVCVCDLGVPPGPSMAHMNLSDAHFCSVPRRKRCVFGPQPTDCTVSKRQKPLPVFGKRAGGTSDSYAEQLVFRCLKLSNRQVSRVKH